MAKRRTKFEIMTEILRIAKKGVIKTRIVYEANLNFQVLHEYLRELERNGLMENSVKNNSIIRTTDRGMQCLEHYERFMDFLNVGDQELSGDCLRLTRKY